MWKLCLFHTLLNAILNHLTIVNDLDAALAILNLVDMTLILIYLGYGIYWISILISKYQALQCIFPFLIIPFRVLLKERLSMPSALDKLAFTFIILLTAHVDIFTIKTEQAIVFLAIEGFESIHRVSFILAIPFILQIFVGLDDIHFVAMSTLNAISAVVFSLVALSIILNDSLKLCLQHFCI